MNKVCTRPRRGDPKELKCPNCDKQFKGITAMDYHMKRKVCEQINQRRRSSVSSGPPYSCDWCGTTFQLKQTCYVHMARKACLRFPTKYALKHKKQAALENLDLITPIVDLQVSNESFQSDQKNTFDSNQDDQEEKQ